MNPLAILDFLKDHWRGCGVAAVAVAIFGAGYHAHAILNPPTVCAPAITEKLDEHKTQDTASASTTSTETGAKKKITLNFDPAPAGKVVNFPERPSTPSDLCRPVVVPGLDAPVNVPPGERLESVTIEEDDPSKSETKAATEQASTDDKHLDLTVKPAAAAAATWRVQAGFEDVLRARDLRVAVGRQIVGPFWLELSATPAQRSIGVGASVQW